MSPTEVTVLAQTLADRLQEDIKECKTREEHIRVTARANEAVHLLRGLSKLLETSSSVSPSDTSATGHGLEG